ncbi:MAG TPA: hypothetical protein VNR90_00175 [Vicinamibacterales bacterium]|jgi:hypothetical protein|nr:hypothetical protein [Vicinamibacterales bacterium]
MTRQRVLAAIAAFAMAVAVAAPLGAAAAAPKKFKATRAFVVDKQTGAVRMPTPAEVDTVVITLTALGQQPADSLPQVTQNSGAVSVDLAGAYSGVMLARPNEDGTWETRCVFTVEEGAAFLGLVEDVQ